MEFQVGDVVTHHEMCGVEKRMLQHGMNFRNGRHRSVILMSRRPGAPYDDQVFDEGRTLIYEGHNVPRQPGGPEPYSVDQPRTTRSGRPTPNGKFEAAALAFKAGEQRAELVRVYEKIKDGIWVFNGVFRLVDASEQVSGNRRVFKFKLELTTEGVPSVTDAAKLEHTRLIPPSIKQQVFKRDRGKCVLCGSKDNLHFDHELPYSKGGTSIKAENIRLLCARHNLAKGAKIE